MLHILQQDVVTSDLLVDKFTQSGYQAIVWKSSESFLACSDLGKPGCAIIDKSPKFNCIEILTALRNSCSPVTSIIYTSVEDISVAVKAISEFDVASYVLHSDDILELLEQVKHGLEYSQRKFDEFIADKEFLRKAEALSALEIRVLDQFCHHINMGSPLTELIDDFSPVFSHVPFLDIAESIKKKLQIRDSTDLFLFAMAVRRARAKIGPLDTTIQ